MRISDWSSDVCSSDLGIDLIHILAWVPEFEDRNRMARGDAQEILQPGQVQREMRQLIEDRPKAVAEMGEGRHHPFQRLLAILEQIGSASCRERVCQNV